MAAVTAFWPYGGPGRLYGSFAGKTEQIVAASVAGLPTRRRYVLPNGLRVTATPDEAARMLASMQADVSQVQASPVDMADLRDSFVATLKTQGVQPVNTEDAAFAEMRRKRRNAVIVLLMAS